MRRSAAPSKRSNFTPPLAPIAGNSSTVLKSVNAPISNTAETFHQFQNAARSTSSLLNLITPVENVDPTPVKEALISAPTQNDENRQLFNVVYGKKSGKKHKTWQGDGTLEIVNNSAVLKDLDGKVLGRVANLKNVTIEEGTILSVGNNEVQLIDRCTKLPQTTTTNDAKTTLNNVPKRKIVERSSDQISRLVKKRRTIEEPKDLVDALVMPCPSTEHQWLYNKSKKKICEVIVDPKLTRVLRPHQRFGITFLYKCILGFHNQQDEIECNGAILADEMGLGKTLQCITLIWTILKQGPYGGEPLIRRILIVTPSSLVANWQNEFEKWLGKYTVRTFIVDAKHRPKDYVRMEYVPVLIISYEMLIRHFDDLTNIKFDLLICDEGHRLKNSSIKAANMLSSLACNRRILLSGTPIQNDLQEFYTLVNFVNPNYLGTPHEYRQYFEDPITKSRNPDIDDDVKVLGEMRAMELNEKTSHFILRRTQEINNKYLPTKHEIILFCFMSPLQKQMSEALIDYWASREVLNSMSISTEITHLHIITLLKKICNHPKLLCKKETDDPELNVSTNSRLLAHLNEFLPNRNDILDSGKFAAVVNILQTLSSTKERIVLVSYFTQTLDLFQDYCDQKGYKYCRLDGSTSVNQRNDIVKRFNKSDSNIFVFLLSARAGGVGLNLTGASRLILYDSEWNPATDLQAMSRIWRDGQTSKNVYIYRLITTGSVEEKIFQRQIFKTGLSGAVVDPSNTSNGIKLSHEDLKDLFQLNFESECLTHSLLNCACSCDGNVIFNHETNNENHVDEERDCQLGVVAKHTQANLKMNELGLWEHYGRPFNHDLLRDLAVLHTDVISFIFRNKCT